MLVNSLQCLIPFPKYSLVTRERFVTAAALMRKSELASEC